MRPVYLWPVHFGFEYSLGGRELPLRAAVLLVTSAGQVYCLPRRATGRFRIKGAAPENFLSAPPTLGGCTSLLERFTLRRQQVLQSHFFLYGKMKQ